MLHVLLNTVLMKLRCSRESGPSERTVVTRAIYFNEYAHYIISRKISPGYFQCYLARERRVIGIITGAVTSLNVGLLIYHTIEHARFPLLYSYDGDGRSVE